MGTCTSSIKSWEDKADNRPEPRSRAPLGNKTTNAKARTGQVGGTKNFVKDFEKTQVKPTTTQKPKHKSAEVAPIDYKVEVKQKGYDEEEEPEYAPPRPKDLPYESDVLPRGFLTFEGLKNENLLKGYYQHFYNPVDDQGVTRQEREFEETMKRVVERAEKRNKEDLESLTWNVADLDDPAPVFPKASLDQGAQATTSRAVRGARSKQPSTIASRRAASALSVHSDTTRSTEGKPVSQPVKARKPLTSLLRGKQTAQPVISAKATIARATGEAASRTTIGYSRGRSASSMLHTRGTAGSTQRGRSVKTTTSIESGISDLTITPARLRQAAAKKQDSRPRPQFASIFDDIDGEDEDLPPLSQPLQMSEDEDEDFELKFDI